MDTYYTSSSSHREAAQVLYVREPFHNSFPEAPTLPGNMMMYLNSGPYSDALSENSQLKTNYVAVPAIGSSNSTLQQQEILTNLGGLRTVQQDVGAWREGRSEMLVLNPTAAQNMLSQGLSLSLGTEMPSDIQMASMPGDNTTAGVASFLSPNSSTSGEVGNRVDSSRDDHFRNRDYLSSGFPGGHQDFNKGDYSLYGMPDVARTIPNSKYLKAAQQLLDEVVNVCVASKLSGDKKNQSSLEDVLRSSKDSDGRQKDDTTSAGVSPNPRDSSSNSQCELSHSERQELQNKLTKLLSMLDEVDRRYRQYYHQMQVVVSSFDAIAGCGAAKPYTSVALQTISRHFRCLRDAITGQIRATQRSLGEQDSSWNGNDIGITRLRFVDQQLRQQRALQQIGMMQQNAWRPQRGLPESSVLILRAWLFEHFLHPYPKDSDKIMLARQTGLTRSQVSNWFINARVRLWKPMVEEMYKEELGDEMDSISSFETAGKATKGDATAPEGRVDDLQQNQSATTSERYKTGNLMDSNLDAVPDLETAGSAEFTNIHIANCVNHEGRTDYGMVRQTEEQRSNVDDCSMFSDAVVQSGGGGDNRLMAAAAAAYHISDLERFGTGNGVSLTLRLQHCEDGNSHMTSGGHQGFVPMRVDDMYDAASSSLSAETAELECLGTGNQQRRFSSSHLVHGSLYKDH